MKLSFFLREDGFRITGRLMKAVSSGLFLVFVIILIFGGCLHWTSPGFRFRNLLVEYAEEPEGIDIPNPRFSWVIGTEVRNRNQTAFRILVASSEQKLDAGEGDLWDTGQIASSETSQHEYAGKSLESVRNYFWKVIVRDEKGREYESPVSRFGTAFIGSTSWKAEWIGKDSSRVFLPEKGFFSSPEEEAGRPDSIIHQGRSLLLRNKVLLTKKIRSAKAFFTGLGYYEFFINGKRVGDRVLTPAKTPYHRYILYDTYDVTSFLQKGENAFGFHLGNGWYNPYKKWWAQYRMQWFGHKKALGQIHITFEDGIEQVITTDSSWKWADGPLLYNCVYDGEVYDANLEQRGWNLPGFDDTNWQPVTVFEKPAARLVSQKMPPILVNQTIQPKEIRTSNAGVRVFDMGQNFAGWVVVKVRGAKNTKVRIRFAEDIHADGTLDPESNENAGATAMYILKGEGEESYEPSFTFFGFRYAELSSENGSFELIGMKGRVVHSSNPQTGSFECDNDLVNKIHSATIWSQKSNMMGYPMDCPQRDERLGWMGDAQVTAEEAMFNFNMARFYDNWLEGIKENQDSLTGDLPIISPQPYLPDAGIEWSSSYILLLWQYFINYGDTRILERHYPSMKRYLEFLGKKAVNHILPSGWIGDWGSLVKGWKEGQPVSAPTAYYFLDAVIMEKTARILQEEGDRLYYSRLAEQISQAYNRHFLDSLTGNYLDGSQMDNAFPLFLGLVPASFEKRVLDNLSDDICLKNDTHLTTGVLGTKYMPEALAMKGRADLAWKIINRKTYPGWYEMMKKYTTVCEFWTLKQSKNHVMMGSIDAWFYKYLAGFQPDEDNPGWKSFVIRPFIPGDLHRASARIETIRGTVSSSWQKEKNRFSIEAEVPFNTRAILYIPGHETDRVKEGGIPVGRVPGIEKIGFSVGNHIIRVPSGHYRFETISETK